MTNPTLRGALLCLALACCPAVLAAEPVPDPMVAQATPAAPAPAAPAPAPAAATPAAAPIELDTAPVAGRPWPDCSRMWKWFDTQCAGFRTAWYDGRPTVYFSGYTWHSRGTYTQEKLDSFNEQAWGGGLGKAIVDAKGDNYAWYTLFFKDSHDDLTSMVGWSWMTYWPRHSDIAGGLGYTVFLMSRSDILGYFPFPAALPLASVKLWNLELMGTFIPKLNGGINHGNVGFVFGRYQF